MWRAGYPLVYDGERAGFYDSKLIVDIPSDRLSQASAYLSIRMSPSIRVFMGVDGESVEVQSFRYVRPDGHPAMFAYCGNCGHVINCAEVELRDLAAANCPGCASQISPARCSRWHCWGTCMDCPREGGPMPAFRPMGWKPDAGVALAAAGG
jgi:hypothetical protein